MNTVEPKNTDIGLRSAQRVAEAAIHEAKGREVEVACAVVDRGGHLVCLLRMDGALFGALEVAVNKAFAAAAFGLPTSQWAESTHPGGPDWGLHTALRGRMVVYPGGLPLIDGGEVVGGIGISGGPGEIDRAIAEAVVSVFGSSS